MWMKAALINAGMRPINAIVDITNYVMLAVGQPTHAFDSTHVKGEKIIVRNANEGEQLLLLDDNFIDLTEDDLVIADTESALALAGIRGGKKDSILPETASVLLEVANFTAKTIRKTGRRFDEKTDSSIRYEKNIDTERVELGRDMALTLFKELFPESKVVKYNDVYPVKTEREKIDVEQAYAAYSEAGGIYPEYKYLQDMDSIEKNMKEQPELTEIIKDIKVRQITSCCFFKDCWISFKYNSCSCIFTFSNNFK